MTRSRSQRIPYPQDAEGFTAFVSLETPNPIPCQRVNGELRDQSHLDHAALLMIETNAEPERS